MAGYSLETITGLKFCSGPNNSGDDLHLLLVSRSLEYLQTLQKCLYTAYNLNKKQRNYNLKIHIAQSIGDVITTMHGEPATIDYIILILDLKNINSINECLLNLNQLHFSCGRERICLLNTQPTYKPEEVLQFAQTHQYNLVNGKLMDTENLSYLARGLLNIAEKSCGLVKGIPLIGIV